MVNTANNTASQMTNQRSFVRKQIAHHAELRAADAVYACELLNVSAGGAKLMVPGEPTPVPPMTLHIEDYGDFPCELIWSEDYLVGVEFLEATQTMGDVAMALAAFGPNDTTKA